MVYCNYCGLTFDVSRWWITEYHKMTCRHNSATGDPLRDAVINYVRRYTSERVDNSTHYWASWLEIGNHFDGLDQLENDDMDEILNDTRDLLVRQNFIIHHEDRYDDPFYRFNYYQAGSDEVRGRPLR